MNKYSVIKGPCLTEKGDLLQESFGKAVIKVDRNANKIEIKEHGPNAGLEKGLYHAEGRDYKLSG